MKEGELTKEYDTIIDTQRIYNMKQEKDTIKVTFDADLSTYCEVTVKAGEKLPSGIKTYINFPFANSDGEVESKGKRLADSSNGTTIKKDWPFDASVKATLPGGFSLDVQLTAKAVQYKYNYSAVIVYDDGNMLQSRGLVTCDFEIPDYAIEYVLL